MIPKKRLYNFSIVGRHSEHHGQQTAEVHECGLDEVVLDVERAIDVIARDYYRIKGLILSEDDLKCALYRKLYPIYSEPVPTLDNNITAIALHTEIPWYDENGLLTLRPDISIIDPQRLSILHGIGEYPRRSGAIHYRLPSKGFEFGGQAIAIETKFVRSFAGISQKHVLSFQKDIDKMQLLCERHNRNSQPNVKGVLVIFSKTANGIHRIDEFKRRNSTLSDIKILFYNAGVVRSEQHRRR
ncbi:MAG: hypothetical protein QMD44_02555 [Thermodesulfovibrionales bacterium]|nr:hypothetical protein [Thermodesulfovibrionales bacterium]